jgi:hypothetical protein
VISPNTRNLEIGLAVLSLAGFALYLERGLQWGHVRNRLVVIGTAALLGVFMYSAAYYLIFVLAPLGLLLSVNMAVSGLDRRQVRLLLFLAASAVVSVVCRGILDQVGWVQKGEPVRFVTADQIGFHLQLLLESGLTIFGANFLGHRVLSFDSVRSIAQLSILVPILASPIWLSKKYRLSDQIWRYYFALLPYFVALAFVFTSYVGDFESRRYLVILPFAAAVTVAFVYQDLSEPRLRKLLALSLVMNIVLGIYSVGSKIDASDPRNVRSAETISLVRSVGLEKGYTHFWLSNINTYLTRNDVAFIQVVCVEERLRFYPWLTDDGILEKPAQSTFYLYDARSEDIVDCTPERLINQLGDPAQILAIDKSTTLAIYDYDISTKFDEHGGD